jgi:hypothetical protein
MAAYVGMRLSACLFVYLSLSLCVLGGPQCRYGEATIVRAIDEAESALWLKSNASFVSHEVSICVSVHVCLCFLYFLSLAVSMYGC